MWPLVGAAIVGALFARGKAPKTKAKKLDVLGARSGITWHAEDFPELDTVIVRGEGAWAVFRRNADGVGLVFDHGNGDRNVLRLLVKDFVDLPVHQTKP